MTEETNEDVVSLLPFEDEDFADLLELMRLTWYDDLDVEDGVAARIAADELIPYLAERTFSRLAWRTHDGSDRELLGAVLARHGEAETAQRAIWEGRLAELEDGIRADLGDGALAGIYRQEMDAKADMLAERDMPDDDCLILLAVSPQAKGLGLGRRLFESGTGYLHEVGAPTAHLITDTTCDWPFYEHLGLSRLAERSNPGAVAPAPSTFFLYGKRL
ncbi:MAG: GNAT family N-acetyltransferase [Atopobiaceae bacterium]|jgi:GNAT superfamily N-acetyltransferase|nr:GNAT family N-acetyltransferase [Atopobiaceae bacterium]MCI2173718.1 GNAT family N-acetyltransferase [Atopobiaceae bacterium]MCI2207640.1 GNAT family N-acetyltransferase [Atopobiaceae bacterium]